MFLLPEEYRAEDRAGFYGPRYSFNTSHSARQGCPAVTRGQLLEIEIFDTERLSWIQLFFIYCGRG
jgi:hypothetical protein